MNNKSQMVLELLKARGLEGIARNFEKNVHPRVADIEEAIKTVRNLLKVMNTKKYMEPEETKWFWGQAWDIAILDHP